MGYQYRILSIDAEKLVYGNSLPEEQKGVHAFETRDGKETVKTELLTGILDYSLESEKILELWQKTPLPRRMYYHRPHRKRSSGAAYDYNYTTAVINVTFQYKLGRFVKIDGCFVRYGHTVSDAFHNQAETDEGGTELVAIRTGAKLEGPPLPDEVLGRYFAYDAETSTYVRRRSKNGRAVPMETVKSLRDLRKELYKDGFYCDGLHYVRYKRSAGSSRSGHCLFIVEDLHQKMMRWSRCGLKESGVTDLASFEAYISLSLSSISGKIRIPKNAILFMKDMTSTFRTKAVSVTAGENGSLSSSECEVEVRNVLWDGEALLDTSLFRENGYERSGMMLLRNRFFKTCAFHTDLQKWFRDNGITRVDQLCGFTTATEISEIRMIVTESSLKYLKLASPRRSFEEKVLAWLKAIDDVFGIVKTDQPTGFFEGKVVRTSYQLLNTLGLSESETAELLQESLDYYKNIREDPLYLRNYIHFTLDQSDPFAAEEDADTDCEEDEDCEEGADEAEDGDGALDDGFYPADEMYDGDPLVNYRREVAQVKQSSRSTALMSLLSANDRFAETAMYSDFRKDILSSFAKKIRLGKLLVRGTNATLFGNGLELLAASIGKYREGDPAIALAGDGTLYCRHFPEGKELLGCRSPHVTMGNLLYAENRSDERIDTYFRLSNEIVYVNAIGSNLQQRLNGCDYDSDTMLLTDNRTIVKAAKRNRTRFPVPVCSIASERKTYRSSPESRATFDSAIAENRIGEIINRSQVLNSLYWDLAKNQPDDAAALDRLYRDICILAVLSGMEIDRAKRNYNAETAKVLKTLKSAYTAKTYPEFLAAAMAAKGTRVKRERRAHYDTTMDELYSQVLHFVRSQSSHRQPKLPLWSFYSEAEKNGSPLLSVTKDKKGKKDSNAKRDVDNLLKALYKNRVEIEHHRCQLRGAHTDRKAELSDRISALYADSVVMLTKKLKYHKRLERILRMIDEGYASGEEPQNCAELGHRLGRKFYWFLLELLAFEENNLLPAILAETRKGEMCNLVVDENGTVRIYGVPHAKEIVKT